MGFWAIDALSARSDIPVSKKNFKSLVGMGRWKGEKVIFAKPLTYMNLSGKAVLSLMGGFGCSAADLIVIHDDIDLNLGRIKLKTKGGAAGHKGIKSIMEELGTGEFTRIRIGIGRPPHHEEVVDYVLDPFTHEEREIIKASLGKVLDLIEELLSKKE